ncbi:MAG: hypothetical protein HYY84_12120 [Deltaproteobacteria bacterium]|nr:hypothetical protein [Deltaproteobacteria bacterium]
MGRRRRRRGGGENTAALARPREGEPRRVRPPFVVRAPRGVSGRLRLVGTIRRPVHVGASAWKVRGAGVLLSHVAYGEDYVIPASVVRGAVRERFARETRSCAGVPPYRCEPGNRCPACVTFGTRGFKGRVWISDAVLVEGRVDAIAVSPNAERWVEAITVGEVEAEVVMDGLNPDWIRPLCAAFGLDSDSSVMLGESHADGRGEVSFQAVEIESPRGIGGPFGLGEMTADSIGAWVGEIETAARSES